MGYSYCIGLICMTYAWCAVFWQFRHLFNLLVPPSILRIWRYATVVWGERHPGQRWVTAGYCATAGAGATAGSCATAGTSATVGRAGVNACGSWCTLAGRANETWGTRVSRWVVSSATIPTRSAMAVTSRRRVSTPPWRRMVCSWWCVIRPAWYAILARSSTIVWAKSFTVSFSSSVAPSWVRICLLQQGHWGAWCPPWYPVVVWSLQKHPRHTS